MSRTSNVTPQASRIVLKCQGRVNHPLTCPGSVLATSGQWNPRPSNSQFGTFAPYSPGATGSPSAASQQAASLVPLHALGLGKEVSRALSRAVLAAGSVIIGSAPLAEGCSVDWSPAPNRSGDRGRLSVAL